MTKEVEQKIKIYAVLFVLAALAIIAGFIFGNFLMLCILALLLIFVIMVNIELYIRIQHNIDATRHREPAIYQNYPNGEIDNIKLQNEWFFKKVMPLILENSEEKNPDKVSIIIAWRNIGCARAYNCFKSIRNQNYDQEKIEIILVDYDSDDKQAILDMKNICAEFKVTYLRVDNAEEWSRSRALNIGIKKSDSKYVLISDIDIIFEENYISECVKEIKKYPYQILYVNMRLRPKLAKFREKNDSYYKLKEETEFCQTQKDDPECTVGSSIIFTMRQFFYLIDGYDEFYSLWGYEDLDILKRFKLTGIKITNINYKTSHIHQWHPTFSGVKEIEGFKKKLAENKYRYEVNNFGKINTNGWGTIKDF